jgi:flagellar protein FliO/FliZ
MKALVACVMALTLTAVASTALADEAPALPAAPALAASATPLAPRPSKPLTLANSNEGTPFGYKLLAGLGVVAATVVWLKKKRKSGSALPASRIDVLGRTSLGVRSELLVVEVEGTRLLLGMTPSAIQTLAVLDGVTAEAEPIESVARTGPDPSRPVVELAERARTLLAGARAAKPAAPSPKRAPAAKKATAMPRVAGQAKGLLLALDPESEPEGGGAEDRARSRASSERTIRLGDW